MTFLEEEGILPAVDHLQTLSAAPPWVSMLMTLQVTNLHSDMNVSDLCPGKTA